MGIRKWTHKNQENTQWIQVFAVEVGSFTLIPGTHVVEEKKQPLTSASILWYLHTLVLPPPVCQTHTNAFDFWKRYLSVQRRPCDRDPYTGTWSLHVLWCALTFPTVPMLCSKLHIWANHVLAVLHVNLSWGCEAPKVSPWLQHTSQPQVSSRTSMDTVWILLRQS